MNNKNLLHDAQQKLYASLYETQSLHDESVMKRNVFSKQNCTACLSSEDSE